MTSHNRGTSDDSPLIFEIERRFAASVGSVFEAWSKPDLFKEWAWASLSSNTTAEIDFCVGGAYIVTRDQPEKEKDDPRPR